MMKKRLEQYILEGSWEEQLQGMFKRLERFVIWPVMIFAACYFGFGFLWFFSN